MSETQARPLPSGWRWAKLGEVCDLVGDSVDPQQFPTEQFAHYSIPAFDAGSGPCLELGAAILSTKVEFPGHVVLFSKLNPRIARAWVVDDALSHRRICSTEFLPLRPHEAALDLSYLGFLLNEPRLIAALRVQVEAATKSRERLKPVHVTSACIPIPPLPEQRRIAGILNEQMAEVEKARAATEAQLEAARTLPAAYLRETFDSEEAKKWPRKRIGELAKVQSGYAFKSEWFAESGVRLLRNANVFQGYLAWDDAAYLPSARRSEFADYELVRGDVILSLDRPVVKDGLKIARVTENDLPALLLQRVGRFRLSDALRPDFLYGFLQTPGFIRAITGHDQSLGVPHVSPGQVEDVVMPVPSAHVQGQVEALLHNRAVEASGLRASIERRRTEIDKLPAALLRKAFSGEV